MGRATRDREGREPHRVTLTRHRAERVAKRRAARRLRREGHVAAKAAEATEIADDRDFSASEIGRDDGTEGSSVRVPPRASSRPGTRSGSRSATTRLAPRGHHPQACGEGAPGERGHRGRRDRARRGQGEGHHLHGPPGHRDRQGRQGRRGAEEGQGRRGAQGEPPFPGLCKYTNASPTTSSSTCRRSASRTPTRSSWPTPSATQLERRVSFRRAMKKAVGAAMKLGARAFASAARAAWAARRWRASRATARAACRCTRSARTSSSAGRGAHHLRLDRGEGLDVQG
jgi:hypothetical protein